MVAAGGKRQARETIRECHIDAPSIRKRPSPIVANRHVIERFPCRIHFSTT